MNNLEKYIKIFAETFSVDSKTVVEMEYQSIPEWDSIGHMSLMAGIEDEFDIMMDTDDIIDFSSFEKGKEILLKYDVIIE